MSTPIPRPRGRNHVRLLRVGRLRVPEPEFDFPERALPGATLPGASADRGRARRSRRSPTRRRLGGHDRVLGVRRLAGAESFLRDAAAQRAWDVVVGLIASDASDDDDDASNSSFARAREAPIDPRADGLEDGDGGPCLGVGRHGRVFARDASRRGAVVALGGDGAPRAARSARRARGEAHRARGTPRPEREACEPSGEGFRRVGAVRLGPKRFARHPPRGRRVAHVAGREGRARRVRARGRPRAVRGRRGR